MPAVDVVDIASDGHHLQGTLVRPRTVAAAVLFVHGWGGSRDDYLALAHDAAAMGCLGLAFDMRGHGGTRPLWEQVTREDNLRDMLAAYDVLARELGTDAPIGVVATSYGAYLAAIMTALRPVRWLGLRVPALYKDEDWTLPKAGLQEAQQLKEYRRHVVRAADNRALRACAQFAGDVLVVESEHDEQVPPPVIQSYVSAFTKARSITTRVIRGADHALSDSSWQSAYASVLTAWLKERVGEAVDFNKII
jgi:dienelactone hydrolase